MSISQLKLFSLLLICLSLAQGCQITNCDACSLDDKQCQTCTNGYQVNSDSTQCIKQSNGSSHSSTNVGLIIGITVSIVVGISLIYCSYKKCMKSSKDKTEGGATDSQPTYGFCGGNFGCIGMGMVDPMNCFTTYQTQNTLNQDKDDYYYNTSINNKFKNLNQKCLDSRNDCDKCAFKLDRKENLFPDWANKQFTKFTALTPSKKFIKITKFSGYLHLIPLNILEMTAEEIQYAQSNPVYEPIKKNSIDDKLFLEKQCSSNSEKWIQEDNLSLCQLKVRSSSTATECPSNRGDNDIATEEMISQDNCYNEDYKNYAKQEYNNDTSINDQIEKHNTEAIQQCQMSCTQNLDQGCVIIEFNGEQQQQQKEDEQKLKQTQNEISDQQRKQQINAEEIVTITISRDTSDD